MTICFSVVPLTPFPTCLPPFQILAPIIQSPCSYIHYFLYHIPCLPFSCCLHASLSNLGSFSLSVSFVLFIVSSPPHPSLFHAFHPLPPVFGAGFFCRYTAVVMPVQYQHGTGKSSCRRVSIMIVMVWMLAFAVSCPLLFGFNTTGNSNFQSRSA